jgi:hypothetical protein
VALKDQELSAVLQASDRRAADRRLSRASVLRALVGGSAAVAGGAAGVLSFGGLSPAAAAPSRTQDQKILNYLLVLEHLQDAFYGAALSTGALSGEPAKLARVAGAQERVHVQVLSKLLGGAARPAPKFRFGRTVQSGKAFVETALELEETAVGAYIATAADLTDRVMAEVGSICAVEGRHAAWVRSLADVIPAPSAADPAETQKRVLAVVRRFTR